MRLTQNQFAAVFGRSSSMGIPSINTAMFWLDGTVSDNEFIDRSGNGRNFTITGKDWTDNNYFPYKSEATISAPVGDSELFAADVNGFFYGADENSPNEIPVVSFHPNIDDEDKIFCRLISQIVDANGVEIVEPHVKDIVLYSGALIGAILALANSFFSVPTRAESAVWMDPVNGNDSSGDGTESLPYKTHTKIKSLSLTEGTVIYIKSGEVAPVSMNDNYFYTVIGRFKIINVSSSRGIDYDPAGTLEQTLSGYFIDMIDYGGAVNFNGNSTVHDLILDRFRLLNSLLYGVSSATYATTLLKVLNSVITDVDYGVYSNKNTTVDTCLIKADTYGVFKDNASGVDITILNSKITTASIIRSTGPVDFVIKGSTLTWSALLFYDSATSAGTISMIGNTCIRTTASVNNFLQLPRGTTAVEMDGNSFTSSIQSYIGLLNCPDITFKNNILNNPGKGTGIKPLIYHDQATGATVYTVENNYIRTDETVGCLTIGNESGSFYNVITGTIQKNHFKQVDEHTAHGVFVFNQNGGSVVKYNKIDGAVVSGFKSTAGDDYRYCYFMYNEVIDGSLLGKGVVNAKFYNNTVIINEYLSDALFNMGITANGGVDSTGCEVKNNIFIYLGSDPWHMIRLDHASNQIDYNLYYCPNTPLKFNYIGVDKTFAEWQALGFDANGKVLSDAEFNALFTNFGSNDFSLTAGSEAIGAGDDLGVTYDDGLDESTNWGDETEVPTVVTKQQTGSWDVGAYVS